MRDVCRMLCTPYWNRIAIWGNQPAKLAGDIGGSPRRIHCDSHELGNVDWDWDFGFDLVFQRAETEACASAKYPATSTLSLLVRKYRNARDIVEKERTLTKHLDIITAKSEKVKPKAPVCSGI